ncbi:MAG: hypothetical protein AB7K24_03915 [Gemmataceae bacterium]
MRHHVVTRVLILIGILGSMGAQYRTPNFVVDAPTPQIAQQVGQYAEHYRKEKAMQWLGYEMPTWPQPCPLQVKVTMGGAGGATSFAFDQGQVLGQHMTIEGSLDRLLASVLPHEVTHTVFAFYFRTPVPRWADEGGSVLSEDDQERQRHDQLCRNILNHGRQMPLRRLFALREYPDDVMLLYAQGYSVTDFLVGKSNRQTFIRFVAQGMREGWDSASRTYGYRSIEELEQAWLQHLRDTKRPPAQFARNTADPDHRLLVRQTVPPQPVLSPPAPVFRGQTPMPDQVGQVNGQPTGRPGYLPGYAAAPPAAPTHFAGQDPWHPPAAQQQPYYGEQPGQQPYYPEPAPQIRLGPPQTVIPQAALQQQPPAALGPPVGMAPPGYPGYPN